MTTFIHAKTQYDIYTFFLCRLSNHSYDKHPWMVTLVRKNGDKSPFCSGTLISRRHVLTAASCLTIFGQKTDIQVAPLARGDPYDGENQRYFDIGSVHIHKGADPANSEVDIAILELSPVKNGIPICLGDQSLVRNVAKGDIVRVVGWKNAVKVTLQMNESSWSMHDHQYVYLIIYRVLWMKSSNKM